MKFRVIVIALLGACALGGCQPALTLEQARGLCTKQGGFLVVIHSQKITMAGVGPEIDSPGDCISPSKFDGSKAAAGTTPPAVSGSPAP